MRPRRLARLGKRGRGTRPRLLELYRHTDVSGVSGTGVVAEVAEFSDGHVATHWPGEHPSTTVWPSLDDMLAVHGHDGATVARPLDGER